VQQKSTSQGAGSRPGDNKRNEFYSGENARFPGRKKLDPPVGVLVSGLPETELLLGRLALDQIQLFAKRLTKRKKQKLRPTPPIQIL